MHWRIDMPQRDKTLARICLLAFAICAALFVATQAHHVAELAYWDNLPVHDYLVTELLLAIGAATTVWLSRANERADVRTRAVVIAVAGLLIAMVGSGGGWFAEPMHDLTSGLGLEGRWSGAVTDDTGDFYFWTMSDAPFVVFGPVIALLAWRGWRVARRRTARRFGAALEG